MSSPSRYLPGDPLARAARARMVRVDHAGEYGAARIYAGQLAVLGRSESAPLLRDMLATEERHLRRFEALVGDRRVRPTALLPLWHIGGFALGAGTALLGSKAAMACTAAVEEVIDGHYGNQLESLGAEDDELREAVTEFRAEEVEHRDTALAHGAEQAPGYRLLRAVIRTSCRIAIRLSERV